MVLILVDTRDLDDLLDSGEYYGTIAEYVNEQRAIAPFTRRGTRRGQPRKTARRAFEKPRAGNRWNKYVAKKGNQIRYKSGADKGKLNLKAMGTKYRKKYKIKKGKK